MRGGKRGKTATTKKRPAAAKNYKEQLDGALGRRQLGFIGGLLLVLLVILVAWIILGGRPEQKYSGPIEKITIGNIGEYSVFDLIAKDKGYFTEHGLDVQIVNFTSGPPAMDGLIAGKADVIVAADFVGARYLFSNPNIRILTQASKHQVFRLIALKDKGIRSPADLKGKTVGVTKKSAGEFYLGRFLTFNDLSPQDITTVDLTPADMTSRLQAGTLDAVVTFDPHAYNLEKSLGDKQVHWSVHGSQKTFALAYSTNEFIKAHPGIVDRYLQALIEAEDYIDQHPSDTPRLMSKVLGYDLDYTHHMLDGTVFAHGLDQSLLLTLEDQGQWLIDNQFKDKSLPNYLDYIYLDGLDHVRPEKITIIR